METNQPIRILFVEDVPTDAELAVRALRKEGLAFTSTRVETKAAFLKALEEFKPDLIISDYGLPEFDGMQALNLVLERDPALPFILFTGSLNEETAVACMKAGATDYVLKDRLKQLPFAVKEALEHKQSRLAKAEAERALRESEKCFRSLIENASDLILILNPDHTIAYVSPSVERIMGYTVTAVSGARITDFIDPPDLPNFIAATEHRARTPGPSPFPMQVRVRHADGSWRVLEGMGSNLLDQPGVSGLVINARDITERKRAEEALRESESQLRTIIEGTQALLMSVDANGHFIYANDATARAVGYANPAELVGKAYLHFVHPEDRQRVLNTFINQANTRQPSSMLEFRITDTEGKVKWFSFLSTLAIKDGQVVSQSGVAQDITNRKRAENALVEERNLLRTLIDNLPDNVYIKDTESRYVINNPAHLRSLGATRQEDVLGKTAFDFFPQPRAAQYYADEQEVIRSGQPLVGQEELVMDLATGQQVWHLTTKVPIRDSQGKVVGLVGISRDITERKRTEEEIRRRAEQLALLYDAGLTLNRTLEPRTQLELLCTIATKVLHADNTAFFRYDAAQNDLYLDFGVGLVQAMDVIRDAHFPLGAERGLIGWVAQNRVPFYLSDVTADPRWIISNPAIRSALWVPVLHDEQLLGVLSATSTHLNAFTAQDERLFVLFANQVAVAMENARLFDETRQHLAELEVVSQVSTALRAATTLDEMLPLLLDKTLGALNTDSGLISLYDKASGELHRAIARGIADTNIPPVPIQPGEGIIGHVFATGEAYVARETASDPRTLESARSRLPAGMGSAHVPIRAEHETIGTLTVAFPLPREMTEGEVRLLFTLADIAGNTIQRMRLHEETVRRLEFLQALHTIDTVITASFDLRMTLNILLEHATTQLHVDAAAVLLLNPHLQTLDYAAGRGFRTSNAQNAHMRLGESFAGRAALERRIVQADDQAQLQASPRFSALWAGEGFANYYGVPLVVKGQVKGVLEVYHRAPFRPDPDWIGFLETLAGQAALAIDNAQLFENLEHSNAELTLAYDTTIEGWSRALDLRDKETEGHTLRVVEITLRLARAMGFSGEQLVHIHRGALLHDIGKMGVPDSILLKPEPLTDQEWELMRRHPTYAFELLSYIAYLHPALDIPYCHHEKWDGTGYPRGLRGEQIPLTARIFAIVDVWDAVTSDRPYRAAWSKDKALEHIREQSGKHFDPRVVEIFLREIEGQ